LHSTVSAEAATRLIGHLRDGGWLIARLLGELDSSETQPGSFDDLVDARLSQAIRVASAPEATRAIIAALVAAGPGPILPLPLLSEALETLGQPLSIPQLRDVLVQLGALASRGTPGQPNEQIGIAHAALVDTLGTDPDLSTVVAAANRAFAAARSAPLPTGITPEITDYITRAGPRHHLLSGDSAAALATLEALDGPRAADNRDRWAAWLPAFTEELGPDHPDTLSARGNLSYWRGQAGDPAAAVTAFEQLLEDCLRVLGPDHPHTLTTRHNLAYWRERANLE
jgi:hypothetical protein